MDDRISVSVLSRAADVIADTNRGLSGKKIISYCNQFAVDHDVQIHYATYPFQAGSKRTALFENLRAFPPRIQYNLLVELCSDWQFRQNKDVQGLRNLIQERYSHLANDFTEPAEPASIKKSSIPKQTTQTATPTTPSPPEIPAEPYDIFLSYSHDDEALMNLVREHLVLYDRRGQIRKWWDRKLLPGASLDGAITSYLASSDIVLLFVSSSFLASDYCYDVEMQQALRQHAEGRSVVVPIILRPCGWRDAPFGDLVALPTNGRPLTTWPDRDEAAKNVADGVMRIVAELQKKQRNSPDGLGDQISRSQQSRNNRPEMQHRILVFLAQNSRADEGSLLQHLGGNLEVIRFHVHELEKDELIYGRHFYTGKPSEWLLGHEGRRYLNDRNLLG